MKPSLYTSVMRGDVAELGQHKDVLDGELTPNHNTVLHVAAQFGHLDYVKAVLEACPSLLRRPNVKGETPLHMAARDGQAEIVEALILRAKELETRELESGWGGAVKEMLRATNLDGDTALHMAARNCHLEEAKYLKVVESLKKGLAYWDRLDSANVMVDREQAEQIMRVTKVNKEEVEEIMRATKDDRDTALHMAARNRLEKENRDTYLEVVKLLSKEDAEFQHPPNNFQETPLYLAAERGITGVTIVDTLVETYKSLLTYSGPCGRTALHAAAFKDFTGQSTKKLLEWKKDLINQADEYGWIPLRYATCNGNKEGVKELLAMDGSQAYITTTNKGDQDTATSSGNENEVRELLATDISAAYITTTNKDNLDKALHIAAAYGHKHLIEELLHIAPDCWEMVNSKGQNVLHIAVDMNMDSVIYFILGKSWVRQLINQKDNEGNTPLHLLIASDCNAVELWKHHRADHHAFNGKNMTPMDLVWSNLMEERMSAFAGRYIVDDTLLDSGIKAGGRNVHVNLTKLEKARRHAKQKRAEAKRKERDEAIELSVKLFQTYVIVAALIATITFAAAFTIPGGYDGDQDRDHGMAILARKSAFKAFVITNTIAMRGVASSRGHGGPARSLELYLSLPAGARELVDAAGFGVFIPTLTAVRSDHAVLSALAERWWDTSNSFHFPIGEMTVTPTDFAAITGLRVGGDPIPFDSGIHRDREALQWFLGMVPAGTSEMVSYDQFVRRVEQRVPELELAGGEVSELESAQLARVYLLYLFGATLYPNKRSTVHLSYLPALFDLRSASRFDWGGAALGTCYCFLGEFSRGSRAAAGYWRVWELWAYEVLRMYSPENRSPDPRVLPRAMVWGPLCVGKKKSKKTLADFRLYLDHLTNSQVEWDPWRPVGPEPEYLARSRVVTASRVLLESAFGWQWYLGDRVTRQSLDSSEFLVPGPLPPRASHTGRYALRELRRFTVPAPAAPFLRAERDYAVYQRRYLAGALGVMEHRAVRAEALVAGEERRGRRRRHEERSEYAESTGLTQLSWTLSVRDPQGEVAEVRFEPARTEPAEVTGPVPLEWAREAMRLMLAMEKKFHQIASGTPLQLHYPPAAPAPAAQPQGRARAAFRRQTAGPAPQKGRGKGKAPATVPRPARTARPETRGVVIAPDRGSPPPQRELRKRAAQKQPAEGPAQKKRREEEEDEDEESASLSSGSGSASDPGFKITQRDIAAAEESEDGSGDTDELFD